MIFRFLRLFPQFRALTESFNQAGDQLEKRNDQLAEMREQRDEWQRNCISSEANLRAVRSALDEMKAENLRLQDRLEASTEDRRRLWEMTTRALDSERQSLRMQVNREWKTTYGTTPFPEAPAPPDAAVRDHDATNEPLGRGYSLPSQRTAMKAVENIRAWVDQSRGRS